MTAKFILLKFWIPSSILPKTNNSSSLSSPVEMNSTSRRFFCNFWLLLLKCVHTVRISPLKWNHPWHIPSQYPVLAWIWYYFVCSDELRFCCILTASYIEIIWHHISICCNTLFDEGPMIRVPYPNRSHDRHCKSYKI